MKNSGESEYERRHAVLGRLVRRTLDRTAGDPRGDAIAERLYRAAAAPPRPRSWPWMTASFATLAATAVAVMLVRGGSHHEDPVAYTFEPAAGVPVATQNGVVEHGVLRFTDGSVVSLRAGARARVGEPTVGGAHVDLVEGGARIRVPERARDERWSINAGAYAVDVRGAELEIDWLPQSQLLTVLLFGGNVSVRPPAISRPGDAIALRPGDSLVARADGQMRVGHGRGFVASLPHEEAARVTAALETANVDPPIDAQPPAVEIAGSPAAHRALTAEGALVPDETAACPLYETSPAAATVADPGPVSLETCRHVEAGLSGRDVRAIPEGDPWVKAGPNGCLQYAEDAKGNRIPDFSHAGYHGGGVVLPYVAAVAGGHQLAPDDSGDDTAALQGAIDAVSALPADARGFRGAVELGAGVFTLKGSVRIAKSGVVLRGQGSEGPSATVLRASGAARAVLFLGAKGSRHDGKETYPVTDTYVPVGARSFSLQSPGDLKVGDDIIVHRPSSQRWNCALGTDSVPARRDGHATPPWRPTGQLTFERRIIRIDGNRVTVDAPLTNALEKEYTRAFVAKLDFADRPSEIGVENLLVRGDFAPGGRCAPTKADFVHVDALVNGWVHDVRVEGFGGEAVTLGSPSKWITVENVTYAGTDDDKCEQAAFNLGGQQNLIIRSRALGSGMTAIVTETELEGPNAVVDFLAVGNNVSVRASSRWTTGLLYDNVRIQDPQGNPSGEFDLGRAVSNYGWAAANSVLWNSDAEAINVDSPPTGRNWVMGGGPGARALYGTGTYSAQRAQVAPESLYRAQLSERMARNGLGAVGLH